MLKISSKLKYTGLALAAIAIGAIAPTHSSLATNDVAGFQKPISGKADVIGTDGRSVGQIILDESKNGVVIQYDLHGLPAGERTIHIHAKGDCTPYGEDAKNSEKGNFVNAGGHLNPDNKPHGFYHEGGPHAGDLPRITVEGNGDVHAETYNDRITLKDNDLNKGKAVLLDDDGAAFVIHAGQDDYESQPTGAAGDRIACGKIVAD